ncbi:hypothetical protein EB155_10350 [archaeon]|nr:hypothetical protein [archaeon]
MNKEWNKLVKWSILFLTSIFLLGLVSCEVEEYEPSPYRVAMMNLNKVLVINLRMALGKTY